MWIAGRPLDDGNLAAYLDSLREAGRAPTTVAVVLAAVRGAARAAGTRQPDGPLTRQAIESLRRAAAAAPHRSPARGLTAEECDRVLAACCRPRRTGRRVEREDVAVRRGLVDGARTSRRFSAGLCAAARWRGFVGPTSTCPPAADIVVVTVPGSKTNRVDVRQLVPAAPPRSAGCTRRRNRRRPIRSSVSVCTRPTAGSTGPCAAARRRRFVGPMSTCPPATTSSSSPYPARNRPRRRPGAVSATGRRLRRRAPLDARGDEAGAGQFGHRPRGAPDQPPVLGRLRRSRPSKGAGRRTAGASGLARRTRRAGPPPATCSSLADGRTLAWSRATRSAAAPVVDARLKTAAEPLGPQVLNTLRRYSRRRVRPVTRDGPTLLRIASAAAAGEVDIGVLVVSRTRETRAKKVVAHGRPEAGQHRRPAPGQKNAPGKSIKNGTGEGRKRRRIVNRDSRPGKREGKQRRVRTVSGLRQQGQTKSKPPPGGPGGTGHCRAFFARPVTKPTTDCSIPVQIDVEFALAAPLDGPYLRPQGSPHFSLEVNRTSPFLDQRFSLCKTLQSVARSGTILTHVHASETVKGWRPADRTTRSHELHNHVVRR